MQQIVNFILRNKTFLLFVVLLSIALSLVIQSHSYHKSKFINSANFLSGNLYNVSNNVNAYFGLREQNQLLQEENNRLKSLLFNAKIITDSSYIDTLQFKRNYTFTAAQVIRNNYATANNVLLINRGKKDSLKQDLGVVSSKGIVGIVENTNKRYATVISVLNTTNRISAQLKKTDHFGSLSWNANSPELVQLTEIPKIAPVKKGDTIITSGRSAIFPKGIPIGSVVSFKLDTAENFYEIEIALFNDMTNLEHVYVIENKDKLVIETLLNTIND